MPPRARKPWSRQQVQDVLDLLAKTSKGLDKHADRILPFTRYIGLELVSMKAMEEYMIHTTLMGQMLATVTWRCKRLDVAKEEVDVFKAVCESLSYCLAARHGLEVQDASKFWQHLWKMVIDSELVPSFSKMARMLVSVLDQQLPQQQEQQAQSLPLPFQQYSRGDCLKLAFGLLQCWKFTVQILPAGQPELLASAPQIAALTLSAARTAAAAAGTDHSSCKDIIQSICTQVAAIGHTMASGVIMQSVREKPEAVQALVLEHHVLQQLLLMNIATTTSQLHYTQKGKTVVQILVDPQNSSSSGGSYSKAGKKSKAGIGSAGAGSRQQQQDVPVLHDQLYTALGVPGMGELLGGCDPNHAQPEEWANMATSGLAAACTALQLVELAFNTNSSSSSSGSTGPQQSAVISKQTCNALLSTLQQLLALTPDIAVADTATGLMVLACGSSTAAAEAAAQGYARDDWALTLWTPEVAAGLAEQMLQLLVPAVMHSLSATSSAVSGGRPREKQEAAAVDGMSRMLLAAALKATPPLLAPIIRRNISFYAASLETAIRTHALAAADQHKLSNRPADQLLHMLHDLAYATALAVGFAEGDIEATAAAAAVAARNSSLGGFARFAADAAATSAGAPTPAELGASATAVLRLLTSCQKLVAVIISHPTMQQYLCMEVVSVTKQIRTAATNLVDRCSDCSGEVAGFDRVPWVVLVAQCMSVAAAALAVAAGPEVADEEQMHDRPPVIDNLQAMLQGEADDLSWLTEQLSTLASLKPGSSSSSSSATPVPAAAALQQLEQQTAEADIQLRRCVRHCSYVAGSIETAAHLLAAARQNVEVDMVKQLAQLAAAVAAALPCKYFCNNPQCLNCRMLSEAELVSGKGSVCSGCKIARYCTKQCQLAHWKQHKVACKQLQGPTAGNKT